MVFDSFDADLFDAVEFGDFEWIQESINSVNTDGKLVNINVQDTNGKTLLMLASGYNHIEIVRFLLEKGADTTIRDNHGQTAFMEAIANGHSQVIELLKQGNDI
jgi:ankyrin repeat protein